MIVNPHPISRLPETDLSEAERDEIGKELCALKLLQQRETYSSI